MGFGVTSAERMGGGVRSWRILIGPQKEKPVIYRGYLCENFSTRKAVCGKPQQNEGDPAEHRRRFAADASQAKQKGAAIFPVKMSSPCPVPYARMTFPRAAILDSCEMDTRKRINVSAFHHEIRSRGEIIGDLESPAAPDVT